MNHRNERDPRVAPEIRQNAPMAGRLWPDVDWRRGGQRDDRLWIG
jgi:hypothetical protein